MKRVWSLLLAAVLLLGAGCHGETEQNRYENPVQRYYLYQDETTGEYAGALGAMGSEAAEFEEDVAAYIQDYLEGPQSPELRTPFPVGTSLEKCTLEDGTLTLELSDAFFALSGIDRTLATACIVYSMAALPQVEEVVLAAPEGTGSDSLLATPLTPKSFLLFDDSATSDEMTLKLYFSDAGARFLVEETRTRSFASDAEVPTYLVEELLGEPEKETSLRVLPEGTALREITLDDGLVTALAPGEAVVTVSAAGKEASCAVTVKDVPEEPELSIGDIYFSDGTTSPVMVEGKTPIGVVFYVGDPSVDDGILRSEHPDCRNGLVVAMKDAGMAYWQLRFSIYQGRVGDWIASSSSGFMTTIADEDIINMMLGYNNTRAIEAFNAAEANWDWNVDALQPILDYRDAVPAPESSSGWYWPSPKELSLLCTGEYRDDISEIMNETDNLEVINGKLQAIGGEPLINTAPDGTSYGSYYWSSAESTSYQQAIYVLMSNGSVGPQSKGYPQRNLRCILAF